MIPRTVIVDHTHLRGYVTGLERVAAELFSPAALAPHAVRAIGGRSLPAMVLEQHLGLPLRALADREAVVICPGFPPGPLAIALGRRCIVYVHDLFLETRPQDLSWKARLYMAPSFRWAVRHGLRFLVNSETTGRELRTVARPDAAIDLLRPAARDVFGLAEGVTPRAPHPNEPLRMLAIGTIEPRKDYPAAIAIAAALNRAGRPARLDIVGRIGWGEHAFLRDPPPFLGLHHAVDDAGMRRMVEGSHLLLCTSKAEGLGLPLLEVQHGGLPVVAPRGPVFEEVLAGSGLHVDPQDPDVAAAAILAWERSGGLAAAPAASRANVERWTTLASGDAERFRAALAAG